MLPFHCFLVDANKLFSGAAARARLTMYFWGWGYGGATGDFVSLCVASL